MANDRSMKTMEDGIKRFDSQFQRFDFQFQQIQQFMIEEIKNREEQQRFQKLNGERREQITEMMKNIRSRVKSPAPTSQEATPTPPTTGVLGASSKEWEFGNSGCAPVLLSQESSERSGSWNIDMREDTQFSKAVMIEDSEVPNQIGLQIQFEPLKVISCFPRNLVVEEERKEMGEFDGNVHINIVVYPSDKKLVMGNYGMHYMSGTEEIGLDQNEVMVKKELQMNAQKVLDKMPNRDVDISDFSTQLGSANLVMGHRNWLFEPRGGNSRGCLNGKVISSWGESSSVVAAFVDKHTVLDGYRVFDPGIAGFCIKPSKFLEVDVLN